MLNEDNVARRPNAVSVETEFGRADFHRLSPDHAQLELTYRTPELHENIDGQSHEEVIVRLFSEEMAHARNSLMNLGKCLAEQLDSKGTSPIIHRKWTSQDERSWGIRDESVEIKASSWTVREEFKGYEGVSDAALVRETMKLIIAQRVKNIRDVYQKIMQNMIKNIIAQ